MEGTGDESGVHERDVGGKGHVLTRIFVLRGKQIRP
jgi:hypothetical protein